jgi:hypothetical protein
VDSPSQRHCSFALFQFTSLLQLCSFHLKTWLQVVVLL